MRRREQSGSVGGRRSERGEVKKERKRASIDIAKGDRQTYGQTYGHGCRFNVNVQRGDFYTILSGRLDFDLQSSWLLLEFDSPEATLLMAYIEMNINDYTNKLQWLPRQSRPSLGLPHRHK